MRRYLKGAALFLISLSNLLPLDRIKWTLMGGSVEVLREVSDGIGGI
jgi:hypothetical protein